ncbi:hypothetical protein COOONC_08084 [Cooperia oncophora]
MGRYKIYCRREHATNGRAIGQIHLKTHQQYESEDDLQGLEGTNNDEYRVRPVFGFVDPAGNASIEVT